MRTAVNGFGQGAAVEVTDEPMASLYADVEPKFASNVVTL